MARILMGLLLVSVTSALIAANEIHHRGTNSTENYQTSTLIDTNQEILITSSLSLLEQGTTKPSLQNETSLAIDARTHDPPAKFPNADNFTLKNTVAEDVTSNNTPKQNTSLDETASDTSNSSNEENLEVKDQNITASESKEPEEDDDASLLKLSEAQKLIPALSHLKNDDAKTDQRPNFTFLNKSTLNEHDATYETTNEFSQNSEAKIKAEFGPPHLEKVSAQDERETQTIVPDIGDKQTIPALKSTFSPIEVPVKVTGSIDPIFLDTSDILSDKDILKTAVTLEETNRDNLNVSDAISSEASSTEALMNHTSYDNFSNQSEAIPLKQNHNKDHILVVSMEHDEAQDGTEQSSISLKALPSQNIPLSDVESLKPRSDTNDSNPSEKVQSESEFLQSTPFLSNLEFSSTPSVANNSEILSKFHRDEIEEMMMGDAGVILNTTALPPFPVFGISKDLTKHDLAEVQRLGNGASNYVHEEFLPTSDKPKMDTVKNINEDASHGSPESHKDQSIIRPDRIRMTNSKDIFVTTYKPMMYSNNATSIMFTNESAFEKQSFGDYQRHTLTNASEIDNKIEMQTEFGDKVNKDIEGLELPQNKTIDHLKSENNDVTSKPNFLSSETATEELAKANSTIAGLAVKTSVSVSLPLSKTNNEHSSSSETSKYEPKIGSSSNSTNDEGISDLNQTTPNSTPSTTTKPSTTTRAFRILKPKLKINGVDRSTRAPRPYVPVLKKPTTTAGPPVSIFKKARTRIASITSSTTISTIAHLSTIRIHYANRLPGMLPQELPPIYVETTTEPETTTEEYFSELPFTDETRVPTISRDDNVTIIKIEGVVVVDRGIRWSPELQNRHSDKYKETASTMLLNLERLFGSSPIAERLWKVEIDGFSKTTKSRNVTVDFNLYIIKSEEEITKEYLVQIFKDKLINNTFSRYRFNPLEIKFDPVQEELLKKPTPSPDPLEPPVPQWIIAVIVIGAASLIFIVLFATVTLYGRHHMRRRYSHKLSEEDLERSGDWENKMAAAYENLAADTIYDADDLRKDYAKRSHHSSYTRHSRPKRYDSWSSNDCSTTQPRKTRPPINRIVY